MWILLLLFLFLYLFGQAFATKLLSLIYPKVLFHWKGILWTFDDVPRSKASFQAILDWLDNAGQTAVLFVISSQVTRDTRPLLIKAIQKGHILGNHGKTDSRHWLKTKKGLRAEIEHCDLLLKELYKEANKEFNVKYYRPGSGIFRQSMVNLAQEYGYVTMLGSVYPYDVLVRSSLINALFLKINAKNDIVVLHDRPWTADLLKELHPERVDIAKLIK